MKNKLIVVGLLPIVLSVFSCSQPGSPAPGSGGGGAAPATPTGLSLVSASSSSLTLGWSTVSGATSYQLYRDTSASGSFATRVCNNTYAGFTDTGLASATTYYYKVRASNSAGSSPLSAPVSATTPKTLSFAAYQTFTVGYSPYSLTTADINGDGKPDLIAANYASSTVSVLLNTTPTGATSASFSTQQTFAVGTEPISVAVADINGDGKPDLVVANEYSSTGTYTVSVLLNTTPTGATSASFSTQQTFIVGNTPRSVTTADVNGDGKPDIIVVNNFDKTVSVLLNTTPTGSSTASFATEQTFAAGNGPVSVTAVDINGDGKPDLVVTNANDATVSILLNTTTSSSTTSFATQQTFPVGKGADSVTTADINGDGKPDLVVTNLSDVTFSVLLNATTAGSSTCSFTAQTFLGAGSPVAVTAADIDGDGRPDVLVANNNSGTVLVCNNITSKGSMTASLGTPQLFTVGNSPESIVSADINGDGKPDVTTVNDNGTISVLLNTTQ